MIKEQVEHIAKLARIELTEKEKEKFSNELSSILDYVDKLNKVDTKNIKPIQQITGLESVMRKDEMNPKLQTTNYKLLDGAPDKKGNYYKVPKIFEW
jgi:aspartyl-tRNA(Asn)/glutamyl-tRNA(Gln) amidotransferase subunit C